DIVAGVRGVVPVDPAGELLVGLDGGDDAAAVHIHGDLALLATTDFFTPVVDEPYDWGRIAAVNALSDIYATGGAPVLAVNLLCWPRELLPLELASETLRGAAAVCAEAGVQLPRRHGGAGAEPTYGLAVTGTASARSLLRNDTGRAGTPLSLTKPLGTGVLNNR